MPRPAKQPKLKAGEITYESLFGRETNVDKSNNDESKSDLSQCTNSDCKMLDIVAVTPSSRKNRPTMPITQPILVPLWHEPSNDDTSEKTMYYVRGTDVDLNQLDENGLAGGSDSEPQIVYKVVPNTHAHVIRYVMAEDDEEINESEILDIVDISKDQRRVTRCKTGDKTDNENIPVPNIKVEKRDTKAIPSTVNQTTTSQSSNPSKINSELKDKCRVLELKCKWSDQKMAEMQAEMKKLKEEMMLIRQNHSSTTVVVRNEGKDIFCFISERRFNHSVFI